MSRMYNSPRLGELLKEGVLPDLGITVAEAARQSGVTQVTFSRITSPVSRRLCIGSGYGKSRVILFCGTFALRGYDSIQLATAAEAGRISGSPITFACFDTRLNKAARVLGLQTLSGEKVTSE